MEKFTIYDQTAECSFAVMAAAHRQHDPYTTVLIGTSKAGAKKINTLVEQGHRLYQADGPYQPLVKGAEL